MRFFLILVGWFPFFCIGQVPEQENGAKKAEELLVQTDVMPEFPGGEKALLQFIDDHLEYPDRMCLQGRIYISFVVEKDGAITQIVVRKGISEVMDQEAIRVVKRMPKWNPGEQAGKPIAVRLTLPITFYMD